MDNMARSKELKYGDLEPPVPEFVHPIWDIQYSKGPNNKITRTIWFFDREGEHDAITDVFEIPEGTE
jgi:hypothetical protein